VAWEGFRFYDLIFPLFLFVVGVVLPFSLSKYQTGAHPRSAALGRIARRVVFLFVLGLIGNNLLQFDFAHLRVTGVLQRIAICYGFAAVIFLFSNARTQAILVAAILVGYYGLLMFVPAPETGKAITIYMAARIIPFDRIAFFFFGGLAKLSAQYSPGPDPWLWRQACWSWNGCCFAIFTAGAFS